MMLKPMYLVCYQFGEVRHQRNKGEVVLAGLFDLNTLLLNNYYCNKILPSIISRILLFFH